MKMADELKLLQKKWKKSKARNVQKPVPDNKYIARVVDWRLERSKTSNRLQTAMILQIMKGKYKDRMLYKYSGIETEENLNFLKADIKALEIKVPKKIINLTKVIEDGIDITCDVTVRTSGEFTNIFINGVVEE